MQSDKFIGIPYVLNGKGYDGVDCLGLCRLFYKEHGWKQTFWDGGELLTHDSIGDAHNWGRLMKYLNKHMKRVYIDDLQYGDIIVFNVRGDAHLGIYIQDDLVLAQMVPCIEGETSSVLYHKHVWELGFKKAYRRIEKDMKEVDFDASAPSEDAGSERQG